MKEPRINDNRETYRLLARVAIPIALQSLISSSLSLIDNLMVGYLGEDEMAGVGVGIQIYFIGWIISFGFAAGASTFIAQFWGTKDLVNIRRTLGFASAVCVSVGLLFFTWSVAAPMSAARIFTDIPKTLDLASEYIIYGSGCFILMPLVVCFQMTMQATQQTKVPMFISMIAFSMNTFMNWILIFGHLGAPAMGIRGAALATVFSRVIETALYIYVIFIRRNIIRGKAREFFSWSRELAFRVTKNAIPTTLNEGGWALATTAYVAIYARTSVTEYAAFQAAETIDRLFIMAAFSVGEASLIILGQKLGEGKTDEAFETSKLLLKVTTVLGVIFGVALMLLGDPILKLYSFTPEGHHIAFVILIIYGATMFMAVNNGCIITGILRSGGDTRFAMLLDCGTIWLVGVPMAFLAASVLGMPIYIAVLMAKTEEAVKLIISIKRFLSRKWVRNVISDL